MSGAKGFEGFSWDGVESPADFTREEMLTCGFVDRRESVVLYGGLGNGKTPTLEALCDPSGPRRLRMLAKLGGPWGVADAGEAAMGAAARGADRATMGAARSAVATSTRPADCVVRADDLQARMLARRMAEPIAGARPPNGPIAGVPSGDPVRERPLTVPGIGPGTASELAIGIDT